MSHITPKLYTQILTSHPHYLSRLQIIMAQQSYVPLMVYKKQVVEYPHEPYYHWEKEQSIMLSLENDYFFVQADQVPLYRLRIDIVPVL